MKTPEDVRSILSKHQNRKRFGVRRLAIFGSHAREEATPPNADFGFGNP